jgi:hypothetical protein
LTQAKKNHLTVVFLAKKQKDSAYFFGASSTALAASTAADAAPVAASAAPVAAAAAPVAAEAASVAAAAAAAGAVSTTAGAGAGAGASSFLPQATKAAAAITAAKTSDLFILKIT